MTDGRVVMIFIEDEDTAWDVFNAAGEGLESGDVTRVSMVDADHPWVAEWLSE